MKALQVFAATVLIVSGGIAKAQVRSGEEHKPQPVARHASTFSLELKGPYKRFDDKKKEPFVKKDAPFFLKLVFANTADEKVEIPPFSGNSRGVWDVRDSKGNSVLTDQCTKPNESADRPITKLPPFSAGKGDRSVQTLYFGTTDGCFNTSVPGTYTLQLHVPDPNTGTTVHSNKLKVKVKVKETPGPRPLAGHVSTFSIRIDGPYRDYRALEGKKKEVSVKKGQLFTLSFAVANNADDSIVVREFTEDTPFAWDIKDSHGKSGFTERCIKPRQPPRVLIITLLPDIFLEKGERTDRFVVFGDPDRSCFETDVPGTYAFQSHVPDPYTGTVVYSNKLKIKVTE